MAGASVAEPVAQPPAPLTWRWRKREPHRYGSAFIVLGRASTPGLVRVQFLQDGHEMEAPAFVVASARHRVPVRPLQMALPWGEPK
ncbi:hypothetical protein J4558_00155 [Leptolyngbya sp. 15MV]|nr:hypothetical protein J4558_00155 [Leptolyngbya sp. 15MV]